MEILTTMELKRNQKIWIPTPDDNWENHIYNFIILNENVKPPKDGIYNKTIVWNHRTDSIKSFNNFQSVIWDLRKERQDFRVWIPLMMALRFMPWGFFRRIKF